VAESSPDPMRTLLQTVVNRGLTLDLGHAESSTCWGKRESKDGKEDVLAGVPAAGC
jgi:hypothetical protein